MKLMVDKRWFGDTGIGRYASEMHSSKPENLELCEFQSNIKIKNPFSPFYLTHEINKFQPNVFWSPGFIPPFKAKKTLVVITIHDLTHLHYYSVFHKFYFNAFLRHLIRKSDLIFTISDYSRSEILQWTGLDEKKVVRNYLGVNSKFNPDGPSLQLSNPYILYIGNRRCYKNIPRLMMSFKLSGLLKNGFVLALTGFRDKLCIEAEEKADLVGKIHYFGHIQESLLPNLYRGAHALAFPSLYEGFGLPIIEAMASGIPVLTSNRASMPEISGGAALLADPENIEDIALNLYQICMSSSLRAKLIDLGLARSDFFKWHKTSKTHWDAIMSLK